MVFPLLFLDKKEKYFKDEEIYYKVVFKYIYKIVYQTSYYG